MKTIALLYKNKNFWIATSFFMIALLGLNLRAKPQYIQPDNMDAHSYIKMAKNFQKARLTVPEHHMQRLLGPVVVSTLHTIFGIDHKQGFRLLAIAGFSTLGILLFIFFVEMTGDPWFGFSGSLIILMAQYQLRYTLENFYQICDLYTYLFTLVILITLIRKNMIIFFITSFCAILVRQNMIVLAGMGTVYFLTERVFRKNEQERGLIKWAAHWLLHERGWIIIIGGAVQIGEILMLFYISKTGRSTTLSHLKLIIQPSYALIMIREVLFYGMPFTMVFILHWKMILKYSMRYYPVAIFSVLTIYQPFSVYFASGYYNSTRIMMQGLWLWQFVSLVAIWKIILNSKNHYLRIFIYGFPVIWLIPLFFKSSRIFKTPHIYLSIASMIGITVIVGLLTWEPFLKKVGEKVNIIYN